jgi:hypothetical protein
LAKLEKIWQMAFAVRTWHTNSSFVSASILSKPVKISTKSWNIKNICKCFFVWNNF